MAEALAAAIAVALEAAKAATSAAETDEPWLTDRAAAIALEAACKPWNNKSDDEAETSRPECVLTQQQPVKVARAWVRVAEGMPLVLPGCCWR